MHNDTAVKNGKTAKADSTLGSRPTPSNKRRSADLQKRKDALKQEMKALDALINAEDLAEREIKRLAREAEKEAETEGLTERIYKTLYAARKRKDGLAQVKSIYEEFLNNAIRTRYSEQAMKDRREARIKAQAEAAKLTLAEAQAQETEAE